MRFKATRRFGPSEAKRVTLVALAGECIVYGGNGWIDGKLDDAAVRDAALGNLK